MQEAGVSTKYSKQFLTAGSIALLYIVASALWIFGSDQLIVWLDIPSYQTSIFQTIKGLLFVFASGALIYLLIRRRTRHLKQQNSEITELTKELHHRIKNNLALISSLIELEKDRYEEERDLDEFINQTNIKIQTIGIVHELAYHQQLIANIDVSEFLEEYKRQVLRRILPNQTITVHTSGSCNVSLQQAIPISLLLYECASYAQQHVGGKLNEFIIQADLHDSDINLSVACQNGQARLPIDPSYDCIQMQLANILAKQLDANLFASDSSSGNELRIQIPISKN